MIFNVNAAAVAALALTMAVQAAPSPSLANGIVRRSNVNSRSRNDKVAVNVMNNSDNDESQSASKGGSTDESHHGNQDTLTVNALNSKTPSQDIAKSDAAKNVSTDKSQSTRQDTSKSDAAKNVSTDKSQSASQDISKSDAAKNVSTDKSQSIRQDTSKPDAAKNVSTDKSNNSNQATVTVNALNGKTPASQDIAKSDAVKSGSTDKSQSTSQDTARSDPARQDTIKSDDKSRHCGDCKSEIVQGEKIFKQVTGQIVGQVFETKHTVLQVVHLTKRCSPEVAAQKCGSGCNGFIGSFISESNGFDLLCLGQATSEVSTVVEGIEYEYIC